MTAPKRIQLSRRKGSRKPADAVVVARPSRWGNPFAIDEARYTGLIGPGVSDAGARAFVARCYADWLRRGPTSPWWFSDGTDIWRWQRDHLPDLAGKDLACWCPVDGACHGDVLLSMANPAAGL